MVMPYSSNSGRIFLCNALLNSLRCSSTSRIFIPCALITEESVVLTAVEMTGLKQFCTDLVSPLPSASHFIPVIVPTSLISSFLESATCMFMEPLAPSSNGTPESGSMYRTLESVPHLSAICMDLLIKYTSQ